jgi:hypothetical protein
MYEKQAFQFALVNMADINSDSLMYVSDMVIVIMKRSQSDLQTYDKKK